MSIWRCRSLIYFAHFLTAMLIAGPVQAAVDFNWSGAYRVEGLRIENPEVDNIRRDKAYVLHHLVLRPRLVAADGLTIHSRLDLFNNCAFGQNNQLGQFFGNGPGGSPYACDPAQAGSANVTADNGESDGIAVNELYASWTHEYGQLIAGRAPKHFGLGMTHNAGLGLFDHWFDNHDVVGYRFIVGNLFVMPMIAKVNEGNIGIEDDVNDYIIHLQYENPESQLALGIYYQSRVATRSGNDAPTVFGTDPTAAPSGDFTAQYLNIFTTQKLNDFSVGVEAGFNSGSTGVATPGGEIGISSFGVATELGYAPEESRWAFGLRAGFATGDDPGTADQYEGFIFDRNYDVAFLLFNHVLGQGDPLRTGVLGGRSVQGTAASASSLADTEAISNAIYVAPYWKQRFSDQWAWGGTVATGWLNVDPYQGSGTQKELGYELDLHVTYNPYERLVWESGAAVLFPGSAFEGGTNGFATEWAYGLYTKAAISF